ncbi:MAG: hypothetical protein KKA05_08195 [Alphaproteobacteria bacterium]|nr:hypothetical protein [Alphaproteobacteria bacterium]
MAMLLDMLHTSAGLLMLAGGGQPGLGRMNCTVPNAPVVRITPHSAPIKYDMTKSSKQLDVLGARDVDKSRDSMTGGLRLDRPVIESRVSWGYNEEQINGRPTRVCMWYAKVEVDIRLNPVIYVANEQPAGACRDAILHHERRHVEVDREVMNRFASDLGLALKRAVDETGAFGPFPASQKEALGKELQNRVRGLIEAHEKAMQATMTARQMAVDSRAEYERISAICNKAKGRR